MKIKFINPFILCYFLFIVIFYVLYLQYFALSHNRYIVADWLINYQSGFVRRGLSGFSMIRLSDFLDIKVNFVVMWSQLLTYVAFLISLFMLLHKKTLNIWYVIILLSPVTLIYPILDWMVVGRKEIILFLLFSLYTLSLNKKTINSWLIIISFSAALLIATLFHELVFFYAPYFIFVTYLKSKTLELPFILTKSIWVIAGSTAIMIPILWFGMNINGTIICEGLMQRGFTKEICQGVLSWPQDFGVFDVFEFAKANSYFSNYSICLFLGLIPFAFFLKSSSILNIKERTFFTGFLLLFLYSLPLFIFALDWGRWIHIHLMLLLISSTVLLDERAQLTNHNSPEEKVRIPNIWKPTTIISRVSNNIIFLSIMLFYLASWSMKLYGSFSVFSYHYYLSIYNFYNHVIQDRI